METTAQSLALIRLKQSALRRTALTMHVQEILRRAIAIGSWKYRISDLNMTDSHEADMT